MEQQRPIVIKRVMHKHGHHGGAWKVALADFVTAMMAFFLLMWLFASTNQAQRAGISEFFQKPSLFEGSGGSSIAPTLPGASSSMPVAEQQLPMADLAPARPPTQSHEPDAKASEEMARERDRRRLESLMRDLEEAVARSQALEPFKDQLLIDITPSGLRIQIVDKENRPMFSRGSAELMGYSADILRELGAIINNVPNRISITGHTDAAQYPPGATYTNWELSAERANAARRGLIVGSMLPGKINRVVGLADTVPFNKVDPMDITNRRISIIVLSHVAEAALNGVEDSLYDGSDSPFAD